MEKTPIFEISKDLDEYRFSLKASNGQTILESENYSTIAALENAVASVRLNSQKEDRYKLSKIDVLDIYYWNLKATNGQTIGLSIETASIASAENIKQSIKYSALIAKIKYI